MRKIHRSNRGVEIDMEALRLQNEKAVAVGNMRVNARGDELGPGGEVVKTAKERVEPYYRDNPKAVKRVSLKSPLSDDEKELLDEPEKVVKKERTEKPAKAKAPTQKEVELPDKSIKITDIKE